MVTAKCSSVRKSLTSLTLKPEMIKRSEEGASKAEIGQKLGLLPQALSQAVNAKKKFQKEIKNAAIMTQMIRKQNNIIPNMEKVLVV